MTKNKSYGKKAIPLFGSIVIVFILISAATAVPQQSSSVVIDHIEKREQLNRLLETINSEEITEKGLITAASFILNLANSLLTNIKKNPENIDLSQQMILKAIPKESKNIGINDLIQNTKNTLFDLQETVNSFIDSSDDNVMQLIDFSFLQTLISILTSFLKNNGAGENGNNSNGGLFFSIGNIFGIIISVITFIIKGILKGVQLLIGGVFKIIAALVSIVLLIIGGIQTTLTIGAFFLIFIGFASKIGLQVFSILGAPIFALLAAKFTVSAGKLLGGLTMSLLSLLSLITFFALPLIVVLGLWYLSSEDDDDNDGNDFTIKFDAEGPVYMLVSVFLNLLK